MPSLQSVAEEIGAARLPCLMADACGILDVASGPARLKPQSMKAALSEWS